MCHYSVVKFLREQSCTVHHILFWLKLHAAIANINFMHDFTVKCMGCTGLPWILWHRREESPPCLRTVRRLDLLNLHRAGFHVGFGTLLCKTKHISNFEQILKGHPELPVLP